MIKTLIVIAALLLSSEGNAASVKKADPAVFEYVCNYAYVFYGASCEAIEPPFVVISRIVQYPYYGVRYLDEPIVFVNPSVSAEMQEAITVHETMHYVLDFGGGRKDRCQSEEAARRVTALWMSQPYSSAWRTTYRCEVS